MSKILVIEDNADILEEVLTWLALEDHEALGATNGREGVEKALQQRPDLILCDIMMPEKDGYRVLLELRTQPMTALTPFIFMTAKQAKFDIRHGMELGADDYITKPFGREELLNAVQSRLARRTLFEQQSEQRVRAARDKLLRMLPHELRTPLVGILGIGELLSQDAEGLTPDEISEYADMIITSGQQLYRLIENHLLYAQLELYARDPASEYPFDEEQVAAVIAVIPDTCSRIANSYSRINDLTVSLQPAAIRITRQDLAKIVYELVDNAYKFSKTGAAVAVTGSVQDNHYLLTVSDRGRGIAPEHLTQIEAYVQFERATFEQQGSGLGLAITQQLVNITGGTLTIDSTVGGGTVVSVKLPLAELAVVVNATRFNL